VTITIRDGCLYNEERKNMMLSSKESKIINWAKKEYSKGYNIFADYQDVINDNQVCMILKAKHPTEAFYDWVYKTYEESELYIWPEIIKECRRDISELNDEGSDEIQEILQDYIHFIYPKDHFLKQEIRIDIYIDTGDSDFDFVCNAMYPHYNGDINKFNDIEYMKEYHYKGSLFWLAKTQGYDEKTLIESLKYDNASYGKFLDSVYNELANMPTHMPCLIFLKRYTLEELIDIVENERDIVIDINTFTGLYDKWSGGGGPFEIQLKKPIVVPHKYIFQMLPVHSYQYNIENCYGMSECAWNGRQKTA